MTRITHVLLLALLGLTNAKPSNLRRQLQEARVVVPDLETVAPTDAATMFATASATDAATSAVTEAATVADTEAATVAVEAATEAATMAVTEAATEAPNMKTFAPSFGDGGGASVAPKTEAPTEAEDEFTCKENPATYTLNVDLQITYADSVETCSDEEETAIMDLISSALNAAFPTSVPDWDGDAKFEDFNFDSGESVDSVGGLVELRRLRGQAMANARRLAFQASGHRKLATCDARGNLPCDSGYCRWGCLEVETTHCSGNPSITLMEAMSGDLTAALNAMENRPDCLGTVDGLRADVLAEGGNEIIPIPKEETQPPTEEGTEESLTIVIPEGDSKDEFPLGEGDSKNGDITMTDGDDIFNIETKVTIRYFDGQGGIMEGEKLETFNTRLEQLEASVLRTAEEFGHGFAKYEVTDLKQSWDDETNTLTLVFISRVELLPGYGEGQNDHSIARIMATPDFKEHIHTLMQYKIGGINQLRFTCTGHGARR